MANQSTPQPTADQMLGQIVALAQRLMQGNQQPQAMKVAKIDADEQLVFGWATIIKDANGLIVDSDGEAIEPAELEPAVYDYVLDFRDAGELHKGESKGRLVESMMVTPEKLASMGLPSAGQTTGWWVGYKIDDPAVFAKVKDGTYGMFSIQGKANVVEVEAA